MPEPFGRNVGARKRPAVRQCDREWCDALHRIEDALVILEPLERVHTGVRPQSAQAGVRVVELRGELQPCFVLLDEPPRLEIGKLVDLVRERPCGALLGFAERGGMKRKSFANRSRADHADLQCRRLVVAG